MYKNGRIMKLFVFFSMEGDNGIVITETEEKAIEMVAAQYPERKYVVNSEYTSLRDDYDIFTVQFVCDLDGTERLDITDPW